MNRKQTMMICAAMLLTAGAYGEIRVGSAEAVKAATSKPQPVYSPVARQMKVAGRVEVEAMVDESGKVESVKAVNGNPLLTQSAVSAVQKWKFTPFTADGKPTKAIATISFEFRP
jgi:protein TonB